MDSQAGPHRIYYSRRHYADPEPLGSGIVALRTSGGSYVGAQFAGGGAVTADATAIGPWGTFQLVRLSWDRFALRTNNGHYLSAINGGAV